MSVTDLDTPIFDYVAYTAAYQDMLNGLADLVAAELRQQFLALGDRLRDENIAEFIENSTPAMRAGQKEAIDLTTAWAEEVSGERVREILRVGDLDVPVWENPFLRTWSQLKKGHPFSEARISGAGQAEALGFDTTRSAAIQRLDHSGLKTVGFRRVPSTKACDWCQVVAVQRYHSAESASLRGQHRSCKCAIVAIYGKRDPGRTLGKQRLKELRKEGTLLEVSKATERSRARRGLR